MINEKELRTGNYIRDIWSENGSFKVTELRKDKVFYGNCFKAKYKDIRPIPLTEELLLKCGFIKNLVDKADPSEGVYYDLRLSDEKYCDLEFVSGDKNGFLEVCLFPYEDFFRFKYLHEIQNLYFDLTKKELEIKL